MPSPALVFSFIVATLYGSLFHLIIGGDARRLALLLLAGWVGFAFGQILGEVMMLDALNIGQVHFMAASAGALLSLIATWALTRRNLDEDE